MENLVEKGRVGEAALCRWFQREGLSFLFVGQQPKTFSSLFPGAVKRPDFLLLLESIGLIAVNAKNKQLNRHEYTLKTESELKRVLTFERLFRIPVWYAYMCNGGEEWHWISALKAVEVGKSRVNRVDSEEFLAIHVEHFEHVVSNRDLGKLYTHRLPSVAKGARLSPLSFESKASRE